MTLFSTSDTTPSELSSLQKRWRSARSTLSAMRGVLLGQACAACDTPCTGEPVCMACTLAIESLPRCPQCAAVQGQEAHCGACIRQAPPFDATITLGPFAAPLAGLVGQLKFEHHLVLARWFAKQLTIKLQGMTADAIVPMPLHPNRLQQRGFNQSHEIARHLPYPSLQALERLRDTPSQRGVGANERFANVKGAFSVCAPVKGLHLILLDDVVTTSATAQAAAKALKQAGAARVSLVCVARV